MSHLVGTLHCYMTDEFVANGYDLDVMKSALEDYTRQFVKEPRVAIPVVRITNFAYGCLWRTMTGRWRYDSTTNDGVGGIDWGEWETIDESWLKPRAESAP